MTQKPVALSEGDRLVKYKDLAKLMSDKEDMEDADANKDEAEEEAGQELVGDQHAVVVGVQQQQQAGASQQQEAAPSACAVQSSY